MHHFPAKYWAYPRSPCGCSEVFLENYWLWQELRGFRYEHAHIALYFEMEFSYYNFAWTARHPWYRAFALSNVGLAQNKTLDQYRWSTRLRPHMRPAFMSSQAGGSHAHACVRACMRQFW